MCIGAVTAALILGGVSSHLTTEYEPTGGYNEIHNNVGAHIERCVSDNWKLGVLGSVFKDSYKKNSEVIVATALRNFGDSDKLHSSIGLGVGYVRTSYYVGPYAGILAEVGYKRVSVQFTFVPRLPGGDAVIAAQGKVRLAEW